MKPSFTEIIRDNQRAISKIGAAAIADAQAAIADVGRKAFQENQRTLRDAEAATLANLRQWAAELSREN